MERSVVREGELVLIVTNHEGIDVPTIGMSRGMHQEKRRIIGGRYHTYLRISNALRLSPGMVIIKGQEYPSANLIGGEQNFNLDSKSTKLYTGKDQILKYLEDKEAFRKHADWVSSLKSPYSENMPRVKTVAYIWFK